MKKIISLLVLLTASVSLLAQTKVIYSGTVLSAEDGEPLAGASVVVQNTTNGVITDINGQFEITANKNATFEVSFIGYQSVLVRPEKRQGIVVSLDVDTELLDEVVVVGYGTVRASELTTASSGIHANDMVTNGVTSFEQSLQGKLSGVVVISTEGAPGSMMSMEIRGVSSISGNSEPLYVIDGMPVESDSGISASYAGRDYTQGLNPMAGLNPNDIASIEVLKDASATSIYGSKGANGVVIITTKSGQAGKGRIDLSYSTGVSKIARKIDVLSPAEYAEYRNWAQDVTRYSQSMIDGMTEGPHKWQDLIYRLGKTREYSASISGGAKTYNYMVSGNYMTQDGIIVNSGFDRSSIRSNFMFELLPGTRFYSKTSMTRSFYRSVTSSTGNGDTKNQGIIKQALRMDPAIPFDQAYNEDEEGLVDNDGTVRNPYLEATSPTLNTTTNRILSTNYLEARIVPNLVFKPSFGIDYTVSRSDTFFPKDTQQGKASNETDEGFASLQYADTFKWVNENQLTYSNVFADKHALTLTAVASFEKMIRNKDRSTARGFMSEDLLNNVLQNGLTETYQLNTGKTISTLMSYTARVNYNFDKRYMFTASARADGSSKFGKNNKWGMFPSASFAWNAMNEKWLQELFDAASINNFRIRASWGIVGNQAIPAYQSQSTMALAWYPDESGMVATAYAVRLANPDLKWESTEQLNLGLDYGMFQNRITVNFNYYDKLTSDLLQAIKVPISSGFATQWQNRGEIRNRGWEVEMTFKPVDTRNFKWKIMANASHNRNTIEDLGDVTEQFTSNLGSGGAVNFTPFIQKVGYSLGTLWGYRVDGIYQTAEDFALITESAPHGLSADDGDDVRYAKMAGEFKLWDKDENGIIDDRDRTKIGDVNPLLTYGLTNVVSWKCLDLSILLTGRYGGDIYNQVFQELEWLNGYSNMTREAFYGRWEGPGTSNKYPKLRKVNDSRAYYASSFFVEDGSYLRVKNVRLTFNFTKDLFKLNRFPSGSVYFDANNLFTFTKYRGYDPEVSSFGQSTAYRGVDMGAYPQCRTFMFGLNLNF